MTLPSVARVAKAWWILTVPLAFHAELVVRNGANLGWRLGPCGRAWALGLWSAVAVLWGGPRRPAITILCPQTFELERSTLYSRLARLFQARQEPKLERASSAAAARCWGCCMHLLNFVPPAISPHELPGVPRPRYKYRHRERTAAVGWLGASMLGAAIASVSVNPSDSR